MKCGNCGFETDTNHCPLCGGMAFDNTENNNNFGFNTESQQSLKPAPNMQPNLSNENIQESKKRKTKIVPIVISSVLAFVILLVAVINMLPAPMPRNVFMPTGYTRPHANIDVIWKMEEYFTVRIEM